MIWSIIHSGKKNQAHSRHPINCIEMNYIDLSSLVKFGYVVSLLIQDNLTLAWMINATWWRCYHANWNYFLIVQFPHFKTWQQHLLSTNFNKANNQEDCSRNTQYWISFPSAPLHYIPYLVIILRLCNYFWPMKYEWMKYLFRTEAVKS